jgi:hypothetical protein
MSEQVNHHALFTVFQRLASRHTCLPAAYFCLGKRIKTLWLCVGWIKVLNSAVALSS